MDGATLLMVVIAAATAVIAAVQVAMLVCGLLLSRRVNRLIEVLEHEVRPVVQRVATLSDDAARLSNLAVTRAEGVDGAFSRLTTRLDDTLKAAHDAIVEPARQGMALAHALRAGLAVLRSMKEPPPDAAGSERRDAAGGQRPAAAARANGAGVDAAGDDGAGAEVAGAGATRAAAEEADAARSAG